MNFSVQHELPVKVLEHMLGGLKKEEWDQHHLDVFELFMHSTFVLTSFIASKRCADEQLLCKLIEKNVEPFFREEIEEPGIWERLFEFVRSHGPSFAKLSSNYLKDYSLYEATLLSWVNMISTMFLAKNRMLDRNGSEYAIKPKYSHVCTAMITSFLSLVNDNPQINLIASNDIIKEIIKTGTQVIRNA